MLQPGTKRQQRRQGAGGCAAQLTEAARQPLGARCLLRALRLAAARPQRVQRGQRRQQGEEGTHHHCQADGSTREQREKIGARHASTAAAGR